MPTASLRTPMQWATPPGGEQHSPAVRVPPPPVGCCSPPCTSDENERHWMARSRERQPGAMPTGHQRQEGDLASQPCTCSILRPAHATQQARLHPGPFHRASSLSVKPHHCPSSLITVRRSSCVLRRQCQDFPCTSCIPSCTAMHSSPHRLLASSISIMPASSTVMVGGRCPALNTCNAAGTQRSTPTCHTFPCAGGTHRTSAAFTYTGGT